MEHERNRSRHALHGRTLNGAASELAALKLETVDLAAEVITLAGKYTKNGLDAVQPITPDLHTTLSPWMEKRPKGEPLWPGAWAKWFAGGKMLRQDLEAAGVLYKMMMGSRTSTRSGTRISAD